MVFEPGFDMLCVFLAHVFYPEVVDDECELYRLCVVRPKAVYQFALVLAACV